MKHMLLLLAFSILFYGVWNVLSKNDRAKVARAVKQHGFWLSVLVVLALGLLVAAYYLPSTNLL